MARAPPGVEVSHHVNRARVRRPNGKKDSVFFIGGVRAEFLVNAAVRALVKEMQVLGGQEAVEQTQIAVHDFSLLVKVKPIRPILHNSPFLYNLKVETMPIL